MFRVNIIYNMKLLNRIQCHSSEEIIISKTYRIGKTNNMIPNS